ncbi:hypothetical protein BH23ACT12_BH23ACT12_02060 [soil metagenome]
MRDKPRLTAVGSSEAPPPPRRTKSAIPFPYSGLAEAEKAVKHVAGSGGVCLPEQLAAWLGHSKLNSGAFRNKVAAGKLFGALKASRNSIALTELGRRLADGQDLQQARVEAFLAVPLYRMLFQSHRGKKMPGPMGLELEMLKLGVSRKQVKAARQVFVRSAEQAGMFDAERTQMVLPKGTGFPAPAGEQTLAPVNPSRYPLVVEVILQQAPWEGDWTEQAFDSWADLLIHASRVHFDFPAAPRD